MESMSRCAKATVGHGGLLHMALQRATNRAVLGLLATIC